MVESMILFGAQQAARFSRRRSGDFYSCTGPTSDRCGRFASPAFDPASDGVWRYFDVVDPEEEDDLDMFS